MLSCYSFKVCGVCGVCSVIKEGSTDHFVLNIYSVIKGVVFLNTSMMQLKCKLVSVKVSM